MSIRFDIVLVYVFSRRHNFYLNIVKYLSKEYKIGVVVCEEKKAEKTKETDEIFKNLLMEYGAIFISWEKLECSLLVIPNYRYTNNFMEYVISSIKFKKAVAPSGTEIYLDWLEGLYKIGVTMILPLTNERFFHDLNLETDETKELVNKNFEVVSLGSPYKKFPALKIEEADYIVAYPTHQSVTDETLKRLLENICKLLKKLKGERTYLKLHNVKDSGNSLFNKVMVDKYKKLPLFILNFLVILGNFFVKILSLSKSKLSEKIYTKTQLIQIHTLNAIIVKKTIPLNKITKYANFGIEFFLPYIRKGLITGKTSCVWYALHDRLPIYNCDDYPEVATREKVLYGFNFFGVPPCHGALTFDESHFNRISDQIRETDAIVLFKRLLLEIREKK